MKIKLLKWIDGTIAHAVLTAAVLCWLGFLLIPWLGWTEFCVQLPVLLGGCPSFLPSLPTCVMYSIGCLYLSGYSIVSLQWSPVVSLVAPPLTSATSAAKCRFWPHVGCCVLLRGVSFWPLVPVWQRRAFSVVGPSAWNDLPFELHSLLMAHPSKFYISLKSFFLSVTGLGAPLSSSLLNRRYRSLQNE